MRTKGGGENPCVAWGAWDECCDENNKHVSFNPFSIIPSMKLAFFHRCQLALTQKHYWLTGSNPFNNGWII